jgi:hypothetical protein
MFDLFIYQIMMGEFMNLFSYLRNKVRNRIRQNVLGNERGQGATEYIMLLVVIVGLVIAFKKPIQEKFLGGVGKLGDQMDKVTNE